MERTGYPYRKPWLRRELPFQRTVVDDHVDLLFVLSVVVVAVAIALLAFIFHF